MQQRASAQPRKSDERRRRLLAVEPAILLGLYVVVVLTPLVLAYMLGYPPRSFRDELSSALAMCAFAALLLEFVLSGRFRSVSGRIGIDITMRMHQLMARSLALFIIVHPFLYTTAVPDFPRPDDVTGQLGLGLTWSSLLTGLVAWIMLLVLTLLAIYRTRLDWSYEAWRLSHGLGAVLVALFGLHHPVHAGRYSSQPVLTGYWYLLVAVALLTVLWVYLVRPWRQSHHLYEVTSVRPIAQKTWEVAIEPRTGHALRFEAGQFVWLKLDRSPYSITEHPFSIASSPSMRPRIEFMIKEAGDTTNRIGTLSVGVRAYMDGPHGALTMAGRSGERIVLIAGGVGLAPLLGILRQLADEGDRRPVLLIYGNKTEAQIAYRDELATLKERLALEVELVLQQVPDGWQGRQGILDRRNLEAYLPADDRAKALYFVCGPSAVIDSVERDLVEIGVPLKQIVSEKFSYD